MKRVGFNVATQFEWTSPDPLEEWLRTIHYESSTKTLHLPSYSGSDELPSGRTDILFHIFYLQGNQLISAKETVRFHIFQPDPYSGFKVEYWSPRLMEWGSSLTVTAVKTNIDPTLDSTDTLSVSSYQDSC